MTVNLPFQASDIVLFQGDSITDTGRNREKGDDLGQGYAYQIAAQCSSLLPELGLRFINRGISGNRVIDLQSRWQRDCLDLDPTWVSIYIGINDTWRRYDQNSPTSAESFEKTYRDILVQTRAKLTAKIVLVEPFVLPIPEDRRTWREDLDEKIHVVRDLAREFKTYFVPLDGLFAQAATMAPLEYWAPDGVHPSAVGHALIANAWLNAIRN